MGIYQMGTVQVVPFLSAYMGSQGTYRGYVRLIWRNCPPETSVDMKICYWPLRVEGKPQ